MIPMINAPSYYYYFMGLCVRFIMSKSFVIFFSRWEIMVTNCMLYNFKILTKIFFIVQVQFKCLIIFPNYIPLLTKYYDDFFKKYKTLTESGGT